MNHSRSRFRYVLVSVGLAVVSTIQLGCQSEANHPEVAKPAKATPEVSLANEAVDPPTDPAAKTKVAAATAPKFVNAHFEAPFRLMVDNNPLNTAAKQMYPSPAIYDVDNDGQSELIVGDIFGSLNVYENRRDGSGDPIWSEHYALNTADGKAIKVSNW